MANPFNKKTWQNRLSEYPTRRQLVDVSTGNTQTVDVTRSEGQIYNTGDGFTQANMNDLEQRIYDAFDDFDGMAAATHTIPRAVPKDITQYYNDGSLWDRLAGKNGFSPCEDVFVGDYFRMSRKIVAKNLYTGEVPTGDNIGTDYVIIADIGNPHTISSRADIVVLPFQEVSTSNVITLGNFGLSRLASSLSEFQTNGFKQYYSEVLGKNSDTASIESGATVMSQLKAEFGNRVYAMTGSGVMIPASFDSHYTMQTGTFSESTLSILNTTNIFGYPVGDNLYTSLPTSGTSTSRLEVILGVFSKQLSLFRYKQPVWGTHDPLIGYPEQDYYIHTSNSMDLHLLFAHYLFEDTQTAINWSTMGICPAIILQPNY